MEFFTTPSQKFDLPKRITRLGELAYNLWWTWQPEAGRLFGRLDYDICILPKTSVVERADFILSKLA